MKEIGPAYPQRDPPGDERTLRLETALRRSEKLAMAGRLAASVMHEINNPSQAIADLVYLIAKEADHPELVRAHAAQIEEQLVRIQYIARQTLSFFRDTPQMPDEGSGSPGGDGVALPLRLAGGETDPGAEGDAGYAGRHRYIRVTFFSWFRTLCAMPPRRFPSAACLCLRLRASGKNGRLTVADNGRGIPLRIQARLFEAFQSDKAEAGNGLGLWICKTIVEKHGGQIRWRSSTEGRLMGRPFLSRYRWMARRKMRVSAGGCLLMLPGNRRSRSG